MAQEPRANLLDRACDAPCYPPRCQPAGALSCQPPGEQQPAEARQHCVATEEEGQGVGKPVGSLQIQQEKEPATEVANASSAHERPEHAVRGRRPGGKHPAEHGRGGGSPPPLISNGGRQREASLRSLSTAGRRGCSGPWSCWLRLGQHRLVWTRRGRR